MEGYQGRPGKQMYDCRTDVSSAFSEEKSQGY